MDEQLAETQKEIERDLRKDMEGLNGKIREVKLLVNLVWPGMAILSRFSNLFL